ncbi:MAG: hypothetical protein IJ043_03075 [Clostridia bacterium]|nr:hypothetical protein [Clostridia bacterium]
MAKKNIYNLEDYADFSKANAAEQKKAAAESAVANYGDFQYGKQDQYDQAVDNIVNMKPFQYDLNADALYEQYKNQYQALGKLAMQDTMGQAAALTGGYGNSYAATAGNQAYQSYLNQLNSVVPELYQLALNRYNTQRDTANSALSALSADRSTQYGEWSDGLNRRLTDRDYYNTDYNNAYNLAVQIARNAIADEQDLRDFNYQKERDAVADAQWQKEYNLSAARASSSGNNSKETATPTKSQLLNGYLAYKDVETLEDHLFPYVPEVISQEEFDQIIADFEAKRGRTNSSNATNSQTIKNGLMKKYGFNLS